MSDSTELPREHPSTYPVQDRSNLDEMTRLEIQDEMLTTAMGGVLPELTDPSSFLLLRLVVAFLCGWLPPWLINEVHPLTWNQMLGLAPLVLILPLFLK